MAPTVVEERADAGEVGGLDIFIDDDLARDVELDLVDLDMGGPRYLTGPGGKTPSFHGQGGKRGRIGRCDLVGSLFWLL